MAVIRGWSDLQASWWWQRAFRAPGKQGKEGRGPAVGVSNQTFGATATYPGCPGAGAVLRWGEPQAGTLPEWNGLEIRPCLMIQITHNRLAQLLEPKF